jgi:diaminopimelate epimerase
MRVSERFYRAHGLGNDYLVFEALPPGTPGGGADGGWHLDRAAIRELCRRGSGEGSDGIVVVVERAPADGVVPLRMFNPDGSEFERSGNGLRIAASWLARASGAPGPPTAPLVLRVRCGGTEIRMRHFGADAGGSHDVEVELGRALAGEGALAAVAWKGPPPGPAGGSGAPVALAHPELGAVRAVPVWVGNPHAVVFIDDPAVELDGPLLHTLGPWLATHPAFGRGTNVQLARLLPGGDGVEIGIWERGVGRTPASGTSSCAASVAAVAATLLPPGTLRVEMPGGTLTVGVSGSLDVTLRGPVQEVAEGALTPAYLGYLDGLAGGRG